MNVSNSTQLINDYLLKNQQIEKKQQLDATIKKQQLDAERLKAEMIRTDRINKDRNNSVKGSNIDISV